MGIVLNLSAFAVRQLADAAGLKGADKVIDFLTERFAAHHRLLLDALQQANERAWQVLEFSLAGDSLWERCREKFARTEDRDFREKVRAFLDAAPLPGTPGYGREFRERCLRELKAARAAGILAAGGLDQKALIRRARQFATFSDPRRLLQAEWEAVDRVADGLREYPALAEFLTLRPPHGSPLLVTAVRYYFRRQVEGNEELHRGLAFAQLEGLGQAQAAGFQALEQLLTQHRRRLEGLLDEIMAAVEEARAAAVQGRDAAIATHGAVLDVQIEQQRLGQLSLLKVEEVRSLLVQVQNHLAQVGMPRGEVRPQDSCLIGSADERQAVKVLLARFRQLPAEDQQRVPALLNGLGKLQVGSGDFDGARQSFEAAARTATEAPARAEALYNAYRAALEEKTREKALDALVQAAKLDPGRFAPFPLHRYEPRRILGAGGFGTAVLCHDRNFDEGCVRRLGHLLRTGVHHAAVRPWCCWPFFTLTAVHRPERRTQPR